MATGEGKTLTADLAAVRGGAGGPAGARDHRQRLPRAARRRDGAALRSSSACGRRIVQGRTVAGGAAPGLRLRRHLLHQQGTGLRLPARRSSRSARGGVAAPRRGCSAVLGERPGHGGAARRAACVRDRRRGRQRAHRRGAHAADHLAASATTGVGEVLCRGAGLAPQLEAEQRFRVDAADARRRAHRGRPRSTARAGRRARRRLALGAPARAAVRAGAVARCDLFQRDRALRRARRQGADRRRVHRPRDGRPLLGARPAPDDRGQGGLRAHRRSARRSRASPTSASSAATCAGRHDRHRQRGRRRDRGQSTACRWCAIPTHRPCSARIGAAAYVPLRRRSAGTRWPTALSRRRSRPGARCWSAPARWQQSEAAVGARSTELGIEHVVLNAKQDANEAEIVAAAGQPGPRHRGHQHGRPRHRHQARAGVAERGGLHVILTEFHESRRIDRQLFGRGARQGDPGSCEALVASTTTCSIGSPAERGACSAIGPSGNAGAPWARMLRWLAQRRPGACTRRPGSQPCARRRRWTG